MLKIDTNKTGFTLSEEVLKDCAGGMVTFCLHLVSSGEDIPFSIPVDALRHNSFESIRLNENVRCSWYKDLGEMTFTIYGEPFDRPEGNFKYAFIQGVDGISSQLNGKYTITPERFHSLYSENRDDYDKKIKEYVKLAKEGKLVFWADDYKSKYKKILAEAWDIIDNLNKQEDCYPGHQSATHTKQGAVFLARNAADKRKNAVMSASQVNEFINNFSDMMVDYGSRINKLEKGK